jgi:hypothetical protein
LDYAPFDRHQGIAESVDITIDFETVRNSMTKLFTQDSGIPSPRNRWIRVFTASTPMPRGSTASSCGDEPMVLPIFEKTFKV